MHPIFEQATIASYDTRNFRHRVRIAASRGWTLGIVRVVDGMTTATVYRAYQP